MDEVLLNRIKRQVTTDLAGFLPKECFKLEQDLSVNKKELSWGEKWKIMAAYFGNKLCYESDCNITNLKPRQYAAAEVLYAIGNLTDSGTTEAQSKKNLHAAIQEYLEYLDDKEIKPFKPLLQTGFESTEEENPIESEYEPHNSVGKLAVKAASVFERLNKRRATAKDVIKKLQEWADAGSYPDVLLRTDKDKKWVVVWVTGDYEEREYSVEACGKTLGKWNLGRR